MFCTLINVRIAVDTALRKDNETEWDIDQPSHIQRGGMGEGYFTVTVQATSKRGR